jgi:hypothetical protein
MVYVADRRVRNFLRQAVLFADHPLWTIIRTRALSDQLKQYEIPASRGTILAMDGDRTLPIVLNEKLYTLYADPAVYQRSRTRSAQEVANQSAATSQNTRQMMDDGKKNSCAT